MAAVPRQIRLVQRERVQEHTDFYRFALVNDEDLGFVGGQYVILNTGAKDASGADIKRAYSIFSADSSQREFDLVIRRIPDGPASQHLATLAIGSTLQFSGPWGKFIKNPEWPSSGPTVLVATDTGITAVLGLLRAQKMAPHLNHCSALWLTTGPTDFLPFELVRAHLPAGYQGLEIHTVPAWNDPARAAQAMNALNQMLHSMPKPENAFLAGDGQVLREMQTALVELGLNAEAIGVEPFFNKIKDPPPPADYVKSGTTGKMMPMSELREGFTTGACSAAAAKAATRVLVRGETLTEIETGLPNKRRVTLALKRCERSDNSAICSIIKDAGDDPDCTHGAELTAHVKLNQSSTVVVRGGEGVATVTKAGLGLEVGHSAINPVPMKNIIDMVQEELQGSAFSGAEVTISVPGGIEMAKQTLNERLGLIGGISILGTTGIVKPYSTAAYRASVVQGIAMAKSQGLDTVVFTTGGKSEKYAMDLFPKLDTLAFIQVGDFIGTGVKTATNKKFKQVIIVGMMGKLSKMADGIMMTHRAGSEVNMAMLAQIAREIGMPAETCQTIAQANTARHVLEICAAAGFPQITSAICQRVAHNCMKHAAGPIGVAVYLVDFDGNLLGSFVPEDETHNVKGLTS